MLRLSLLFSLLFMSALGDYRLVWTIAPAINECSLTDRCQFFVRREPTDPKILVVSIEEFKTDGVVQSSVGGHVAPSQATVEALPLSLCDSYVGLGYAVIPPSRTDCTTTTPDFVMTSNAVSGAWFCINPNSPQFSSTDFFIMQIALNQNASVGFNLRVFPQGNNEGLTLTGICGRNARVDPPFSMSPLPTTVSTLPRITTTSTTTSNTRTTTTATIAPVIPTTTTVASTVAPGDATTTIVVAVVVILLAVGLAVLAYFLWKRKKAASSGSRFQAGAGVGYSDNNAAEMGNHEDFGIPDGAEDFL